MADGGGASIECENWLTKSIACSGWACDMASNGAVNIFYRGFKACDDYKTGLEAMARVRCPVLLVLGQNDQMTPPKAAQGLGRHAANATVVVVAAGHQMMLEAPEAVLSALKDFLKPALIPATSSAIH